MKDIVYIWRPNLFIQEILFLWKAQTTNNPFWVSRNLTPKNLWVFGCKTTQNYPF
jgi:hypothetical protein